MTQGQDRGRARDRVRDELERLIAELGTGAHLPSFRDLASRFGVSREPVRQAVADLCAVGVLETRKGSGTRVLRSILRGESISTLAMLVPVISSPGIALAVAAAEQAARAGAHRLVLMQDGGDPGVQEEQLAELIAGGYDGHLIWLDRDNVISPRCLDLLRRLEASDRPTVLIDRSVPGLSMQSVCTDLARGMHDMVRHLLAVGHRRFSVVSWGDEAGSAEWGRLAGVQGALAEAGIGFAGIPHLRVGFADGDVRDQVLLTRQRVRDWIGAGAVDAVIAFSDELAIGASLALRDAGFRVPDDIAICGYDDTGDQLDMAPGLQLTTVAQPFSAMGRVAVDLALSQPVPGVARQVLLPPVLVVRTSSFSTRSKESS